MARRQEKRITVPVEPFHVWNQVHVVLGALPGAQIMGANQGVIWASVRPGLRTWGEQITVTLTPVPGGTEVHLLSENTFPLQLIDLGKNKENIAHLVHGLSVPGTH